MRNMTVFADFKRAKKGISVFCCCCCYLYDMASTLCFKFESHIINTAIYPAEVLLD